MTFIIGMLLVTFISLLWLVNFKVKEYKNLYYILPHFFNCGFLGYSFIGSLIYAFTGEFGDKILLTFTYMIATNLILWLISFMFYSIKHDMPLGFQRFTEYLTAWKTTAKNIIPD